MYCTYSDTLCIVTDSDMEPDPRPRFTPSLVFASCSHSPLAPRSKTKNNKKCPPSSLPLVHRARLVRTRPLKHFSLGDGVLPFSDHLPFSSLSRSLFQVASLRLSCNSILFLAMTVFPSSRPTWPSGDPDGACTYYGPRSSASPGKVRHLMWARLHRDNKVCTHHRKRAR